MKVILTTSSQLKRFQNPDTKIIKEKLFLIISYFYNVKTIHIDFIYGFIFKSAHYLYNDIHSQSKNILYIH